MSRWKPMWKHLSVFSVTAKSLLDPQEVLCWLSWEGRKTKEGGGRGIPANVSSRDKRRKLATLFFSRSEGPEHSRPPTPPPPTPVFCKEHYCGLQMLDPPVALLSHMDLQLFPHPSQSLNGLCSFFILQLAVAFLGGGDECVHVEDGVWGETNKTSRE